jgi:hypothetical protein
MKPGHLVVLMLAITSVSSVPGLEIELPAETAQLLESPLPGYSLATAFCYTCHSVDYLRAQPPSARPYWQATVVKMQKTFGAPIPVEAVDPIVDYLAKTYGTERSANPVSTPAKSPSASQ